MKSFTIQEINDILKGELEGSSSAIITGPEQIARAGTSHITFIGDKKYAKMWPSSKAAAAIINNSIDLSPRNEQGIDQSAKCRFGYGQTSGDVST